MYTVKGVVGVNKNTTTQHYLTRSAKVVWGLWVLGLHEEAHHPGSQDDLSGPLPFGEKTNNHRSTIRQSRLIIFTHSLIHGHMSDPVFKKGRKGLINDQDPSLRSNNQNLVRKL